MDAGAVFHVTGVAPRAAILLVRAADGLQRKGRKGEDSLLFRGL